MAAKPKKPKPRAKSARRQAPALEKIAATLATIADKQNITNGMLDGVCKALYAVMRATTSSGGRR